MLCACFWWSRVRRLSLFKHYWQIGTWVWSAVSSAHQPDFDLFSNPFSVEPSSSDPNIQMELIDLQCDSALKSKFPSVDLVEFYKSVDPTKFPKILYHAKRIVAMFGSTYLCEQTFSIMKINKSKHRNRLTDDHLRALLRGACSNDIKADFEELVNAKRCQVSGKSSSKWGKRVKITFF